MDNFDLKKYLAEGRLLKEELTPLQQYVYDYEKEVSGEDNAKEFLDGIKKLNTPNDVYDYYAFERNWEGDSDLEGDLENIYNQVLDKFKSKNENKIDNFDLKKYLAEGRLFKENVDFPELEDEFEGAMDAMVAEPKVYLQDIIDASAEEIVSDDYYEIMNAVEQGVYSEVEAVKLAKAWAKEKLSNLAEGRLLKEDYDKESLIKALGDDDDAFIQLGDGREFVIYNPNSNNDDNVDMWGDYSVFAVDQDGEEHEILYSDIAGINL